MPEVASFSTAELPRGSQFVTWHMRVNEFIGNVSASTPMEEEFEASSRWLSGGGVSLFHIKVAPQCIERPANRPPGTASILHAIFPLSGTFHLEQGGRSMALDPGDWGLYDPTLSFRSPSDDPLEFLVLATPRDAVLNREISFESCGSQRFSSERGTGRVTRQFLTSLVREALHSSHSTTDLTAIATQLVRLAVIENLRRDTEVQARAVLLARIRAHVDRNLRDPDLSVGAIAADLNCSKRYLHKIFSAQGQTLGQHIVRMRLEYCREDLCRPDLAHLSVTEVAFSWGFSSQAYFSHAFRRQFNVTPSACRARSLELPCGSMVGISIE